MRIILYVGLIVTLLGSAFLMGYFRAPSWIFWMVMILVGIVYLRHSKKPQKVY